MTLVADTGGCMGHDHRFGHSNLQESQLAKVDSDAKEGAGRNEDHDRRNLDCASQAPLHPGYAGWDGWIS